MARISSLAEAVKSAVRDGDTVALEGFTHLIPHAAGHEIIRQGRKGLTLIRMTPDLIYDQLIGMGCVSKLVFSWGGNPGVGSLHRLRDAIENGWPHKLELEEHSHAAMANAYEAGAAGLPCAIFRGYIGGDLPKVNSRIKRVTCPFTGEELAAIPSHRPDVAVIHAQRADKAGNVMIEGVLGVQKEAVLASKRSVVTVEEIVDELPERSSERSRITALDRRPRRRGTRRCIPVLCAGLLPAQQQLLQGMGCNLPRAQLFPGVDERKCAGEGSRGLRQICAQASNRGGVRSMADYKPNEMMTIAAARALKNDDVCFVGIGQPSAACNLARLTHAPNITLIYESGTLATKPNILPLSIGDGELCETAITTVSVPEMFRYWLQGGRIKVGFLGGAQIDKYANLNTTVVGPYDKPKVRLPGGGGAPEIATSCGEIFIIMAQGKRSFVDKLDFVTSIGHVSGGDSRTRLGVKTKGPTKLITDLALFEPDPETKEMSVVSIHPGVTREQIQENSGWQIKFAAKVAETPAPTQRELEVLRELHARTNRAHSEAA